VNATGRTLLALGGLAVFVLVWQAAVTLTRPAPIRRPTLGFALVAADRAALAALDDRGRVVARESIDLSPEASVATAATLRTWLGSLQPSLAAVPSGAASGRLGTLLEAARRDYGGALEIVEVSAPTGGDATDQAIRRARSLQDSRSMQPAWLPSPGESFAALAQMVASGEMMRHVVASVFRVATGFAIAAALGIPFGLMLGSFAWLSSLTNSVIQCLRPISPIAWLPVATLALGGGDVAAVFLIFLASFFPIVVSTAAAVGTVDLKYRRSAMNFGVRGLALARRVVLPAALPAILTAVRIALGISWVVVVAAEMLGVESGLGFLVLDARNQLRYDRVVAAMIVIGVIGLLIDLAVRRIERGELARRGLLAQ
jgi:NitT/TauT family transport system permease protein